jgi:hypothetical protein
VIVGRTQGITLAGLAALAWLLPACTADDEPTPTPTSTSSRSASASASTPVSGRPVRCDVTASETPPPSDRLTVAVDVGASNVIEPATTEQPRVEEDVIRRKVTEGGYRASRHAGMQIRFGLLTDGTGNHKRRPVWLVQACGIEIKDDPGPGSTGAPVTRVVDDYALFTDDGEPMFSGSSSTRLQP